jgi:fatty-acyl-CoA synthase
MVRQAQVRGRVPGLKAHWPADPSIPLMAESIGEVLRRHGRDRGGRTALFWPDGEGLGVMTYAELLARAEQLGGWLLEQAAPGDRIAVWARNSLPYVVLEYACALSGCILTPFNAAWTDFEARHALDLTTPAVVFAGPDVRGVRLQERAQELAGDRPVLDIAAALDLEPQAERSLPPVSAAAPFLIQFTSGTTGRAKGAVLSHRAALNGAYLRPHLDGASGDDVWLNPVPYHHIGGSCVVVLGALSVGGACAVLERFDAAQIAALMRPTRATRMGGVPTMWRSLLDYPDLPKSDIALKVVTLGGAHVPAALVRQVQQELGAKVAIGFGQSESPMITGTDLHDSPEIIANTVGRPLPHIEVKIVDPATHETLALDEVGEVAVRSPLVMDGYFNQPEATAEAIDAEGFLYTGDLGRMDADGIVRLQGRARELIIRGGENVYPTEVEDALLEHPAVDAAAVIGADDVKWGQQVAGVVQFRPGHEAEPAELEAFVAKRVSHFKVPRLWAFVEAFPMTASGKIKKAELAVLFESGRAV